MDKKKHKSNLDELTLVKAAAWAWYQRGSGFEGRSMREYDVARISRVPKPSRYKVEAMKRAQKVVEVEKEEIGLSSGSFRCMFSPSHTDNLLLDRYEIRRISKELDYYIESSNADNIGDFGGRKSFSASESDMSRIKGTGKKKNKKKGFWLLRNGMGCGSRNDVVENMNFLRRSIEKQNDSLTTSDRRLVKHA